MNEKGIQTMTLDETHKASLELLAFFHDVCEKNRVNYYLAYGTLLGCIRHDGFIPWDDDIDVWMMREDYEKLLSVFRQHNYYEGQYKLVCRESDSLYSFSIARLSDMRYKYIPVASVDCPDMGTFIDIYPLDEIAGQESLENAFSKIEKWNRYYDFYSNPSSPSKLKGLVKKGIRQVIRIRYGKHFLEVVEAKTKKILDSESQGQMDYLGVPIWYTTGVKAFPKDLFEEKVLHCFEGLQLFIPKEYDQILKMIYGDYLTLPPEDQRTQYHGYSMIVRG